MKLALSQAKKLVDTKLCDLSTLAPEQRKRILVIARGGFDTWQSVNVNKIESANLHNFVDFENGLKTTDGDGRVPHISSCHYCKHVNTIMLEKAFWSVDYSHGFVLKDERVQKIVNRFLFGTKKFDHNIPGGSIKRVTHIERELDEQKGLPKWVAVFDD